MKRRKKKRVSIFPKFIRFTKLMFFMFLLYLFIVGSSVTLEYNTKKALEDTAGWFEKMKGNVEKAISLAKILKPFI